MLSSKKVIACLAKNEILVICCRFGTKTIKMDRVIGFSSPEPKAHKVSLSKAWSIVRGSPSSTVYPQF